MSKLDRWLPFKFHRAKEQSNQQAGSAVSASTSLAPSLLGPLGPLHSPLFSAPMQQLVNSLFNDPFFGEPLGHSDALDRWFGDFSPKRYTPSVEVADDGKAMKITAELPGMSKDDVKVLVEDNALVISGEKKNEQERKDDGIYRTERYYGYFRRAIPLPDDVDRENADADFSKGVLTIRLPKLESSKVRGRQIEVKG